MGLSRLLDLALIPSEVDALLVLVPMAPDELTASGRR